MLEVRGVQIPHKIISCGTQKGLSEAFLMSIQRDIFMPSPAEGSNGAYGGLP